MRKCFIFIFALSMLAMTDSASAGIVNLNFVQVTSAGFGGAGGNVSGATGASNANIPSVTWTASVTGLDFDGDTLNDDFTFDFTASTNSANGVSIWGQGINISNVAGTNTSFGFVDPSNEVVLSISNVIGTTTLGEAISFDGFTRAGAGLGSGNATASSIDINGTTVNLTTPGGGFVFDQQGASLGLAPTVTFDNASGTGSLSARSYDLQFSSAVAIPEPSAFALLGLVGAAVVARRRK